MRSLRRIITPIGRLLPALPIVWLIGLFVVPLGFTVAYSVAHATFGMVELGFTTENYSEALSGFYLGIFWRTIRFALLGTAMVLIVAIPFAYATATKFGRLKTVLLVLTMVPFFASFLVRVVAWRTLLAPDGVVADVLHTIQLLDGPLKWLDRPTAVFIGIVYSYLPLATVPLYVAFERVPRSVNEASKDLGGGPLRTFLFVTLPMAKAGVVTALFLTFVPMTGEFVVPSLLGGGKGILYGNLISNQYLQASNFALGSAMAIVLLAVVGLSVLTINRLSGGFREVGT